MQNSTKKTLKILLFLGVILFAFAKIFVKNHHPYHPSAKKTDYKTIQIGLKIDAAIKNDDWQQLQILYKQCSIEEENELTYWSPRNCKPILLIQNSLKFKAQKVYHGLANDPQYALSRYWKESEQENFNDVAN
jgi:hypothetical protein